MNPLGVVLFALVGSAMCQEPPALVPEPAPMPAPAPVPSVQDFEIMPIECGEIVTGNTEGKPQFPGSESAGDLYSIELDVATNLFVTTCFPETAHNTKLYVLPDDATDTSEALCENDDACGADGLQAQITVCPLPAGEYHILIAGSTSQAGPYQMETKCFATPCGDCTVARPGEAGCQVISVNDCVCESSESLAICCEQGWVDTCVEEAATCGCENTPLPTQLPGGASFQVIFETAAGDQTIDCASNADAEDTLAKCLETNSIPFCSKGFISSGASYSYLGDICIGCGGGYDLALLVARSDMTITPDCDSECASGVCSPENTPLPTQLPGGASFQVIFETAAGDQTIDCASNVEAEDTLAKCLETNSIPFCSKGFVKSGARFSTIGELCLDCAGGYDLTSIVAGSDMTITPDCDSECVSGVCSPDGQLPQTSSRGDDSIFDRLLTFLQNIVS